MKDGRALVEEEAAAAGAPDRSRALRRPGPYATATLPDAAHPGDRPASTDVDPEEIVPRGFGATRDLLERYVDVGFSKFVLSPMDEPADWTTELEEAAAVVLPMQGSRP